MRLIFLFLLVIAFAVLSFISLRNYFAVDEVRVPDVMAMNINDAYALLKRLGLNVVVYAEDIAGAEVDSITSQSPEAFTVVRQGRSISLGVHTPPEDTRVPILLGRTLEQATVALAELYLNVGSIDFEYGNKAEGIILAQRPDSSTVIKTGSSVHLTVSRGPQIAKVTMPSVVGLSVDEAKKRLQAAGFKRVESQVTHLSTEATNLVREQSPAASRVVPVSAPVTLFYTASAQYVVAVPNITGQDFVEAQRSLLSVGLVPAWISQIDDPQKPQGVVDYRPKGYTLSGSPMVLVVNTNQPVYLEIAPPEALVDQPELSPSTPTITNSTPVSSASPNVNPPRFITTTTQPPGTTVVPVPSNPNDIFIPPSSPATITLAPDQPLNNTAAPSPPTQAIVVTPSPQNSTVPAPQAQVTSPAPVNDVERVVPISFYPEQYSFLRDKEYNFTLTVDDARGKRELMNQLLPVNYSLETTVTIFGEAELQILINGELLLGWSP